MDITRQHVYKHLAHRWFIVDLVIALGCPTVRRNTLAPGMHEFITFSAEMYISILDIFVQDDYCHSPTEPNKIWE